MREILSTMQATPLSEAEYHRITNALLASIEAKVDRWLDEDVIDIDAHRTGGLLELSFPNRTKLVINTQPPLQEIWLAARSGGHHFKYVAGRWLDTRDGLGFVERLDACASAEAGFALSFGG
jgi:CyaY protein